MKKGKISNFFAKLFYLKYYKKLKIDEYSVLLESQHGAEISGNIFYIIKELITNKKYSNYKIYLSVKKQSLEKITTILKEYNFNRVNIVILKSLKYYKIISSAKYLFNDNTFLPFFIKKDGQIYLNTWHGTPLKTLGNKIKNDFTGIGNAQKNFIVSDYLLYPNEFTMEHITKDYMINNLTKAKALLNGYPRNTIFFDSKRKENIKKSLDLSNKKIYAYMPTWRGKTGRIDNSANVYLQYYLYEIEKNLNDDEVLYVNLHPIAKKDINFKQYKKIFEFPSQYETYDFLNIADCLITDYSSVFFDYAVTRNKIVLFTYDEETYLENRGLYLNINDLPFPKVKSVDDLLSELRSPKQYDDTEFFNTFNKYESENATKNLCEKIFFNNNTNIIEKEVEHNNKKNILIYSGNLAKNGITTALKNLFNQINLNEYNYYISYSSKRVTKNKNTLISFAKKVNYYPTLGIMNLNLLGKIIAFLYHKRLLNFNLYMSYMKKYFELEKKRLYGNADFSTVIQFNGYEYKKLLLFSTFNCNKIVYVHSNMEQELKLKKNQRKKILQYCYTNYDKVALVTKDIIDCTKFFTNGKTDNFRIVRNVINYKDVLEKSKLDITLDNNTKMNVTYDRLLEILNSKNKKFINIGRYSPEKGHSRLIDCFSRVWNNHKDIYLVIIGGNGKEYDILNEKIENLKCKNNIIFIKSISNPYSILKKCDYLVLSSFYEGFGLVLAEADILGLPVISPDICGPKEFMRKNNGTIVENSNKGICSGMESLLNNEVKTMNVDYEKYNKEAIKEFYDLLK